MSAPSWPGVVGQLTERLFDRATHDLHADVLRRLRVLEVIERFLRTDECHAAARDDAFFNGRASRMQRVFDASLLLFHLGLGRCADIDDGNAAGEFGETFLQFLAIVIAGRFFDLTADLRDAALDVVLLAFAFHDRGVFLVDRDALGAAEIFELHVLELDAEIFA